MKLIDPDKKPKVIDPNARKIIFYHGRAPGDNIMFTAGIRDFALLFPDIRINVDMKYPWLWENNPYLDMSLKKADEGVEYYKIGYPAVKTVNNTSVHFTQMFLLDMIACVDLHQSLPISLGEFCAAFSNGDVGDPRLDHKPFSSLKEKYSGFGVNFSRQRGDLHLSKEERNYNLVQDLFGVEKYWIVATGGKSDATCKHWDWRRFQKVIDYYDGLIKFVTVGTKSAQMFIEELKGVIDLTEKFNKNKVRGLVPLTYHAEGVISTPSLLMHLGAAVPRRKGKAKAGVIIFGGREPTAWSWYCNYQILHTNATYSCCEAGGCWKARVTPIPKGEKHNKSLCKFPVDVNGRTIQSCMNDITADDVIRAIGTYYKGDLYEYSKGEKTVPTVVRKNEEQHMPETIVLPEIRISSATSAREINLVGNLNCKGGGEQSLCKIGQVLQDAGWKVHIYPAKNKVHEKYLDTGLNIYTEHSLEEATIAEVMKPNLPLLFYANDTTGMFVDNAKEIVDNSSAVIVGINYINRPLPDCHWLAKSNKLKAVIFQNTEKKEEWDSDEIGYNNLKKYVLFGAIELDKFLEVLPSQREKDEPLIVLKHCVADRRKYVTESSKGKGEKKHIWQKHFDKELDTKLYSRLLKQFGDKIRFEFMEAPIEIEEYFNGEGRMVFHKFDSIPVTEFLSRGHLYLYRTSNLWRDNYPRTIAEALAVGIPILTEPRDGCWERVRHGDTGFHCVDYDQYKDGISKFLRKEKFRWDMAQKCKEWARANLDPRKWAEVVDDILDNRT